MATMTDLGGERFVSITTSRRDGTPVATPVWVVAFDDHLYVWTGGQTGKVKRIRDNPAVMLAPCTRRGTVTGPAVAAQAVIVSVGERPQIWPLFTAKYGLGLRTVLTAERILGFLRFGPFHKQGDRIFLEMTVTTASEDNLQSEGLCQAGR
jgi:PPOX class probable F420-dependent enzyme